MKTTRGIRFTVPILLATIVPFTSVHGHEGHNHDSAAAAPAAEALSRDEAWQKAQSSFKAIQAAAAAKQQPQIHTEQEKLAAALKQLQEKTTGDDKARLDGAIRNAIAASEKVHIAADANDFARVESGLKTLEATMALVEKHLGGTK